MMHAIPKNVRDYEAALNIWLVPIARGVLSFGLVAIPVEFHNDP